jgi:hypothetical protein
LGKKVFEKIKKGFDTLFFESCAPTGASKPERISLWTAMDGSHSNFLRSISISF